MGLGNFLALHSQLAALHLTDLPFKGLSSFSYWYPITLLIPPIYFKPWMAFRSNPGACREPMARIRQYSIPLINRPHNNQEWVIAYSDRELYYNTTANTSISLNTRQPPSRSNLRGPVDIQTLIAVTVSGYFGGSNLIRCIRIWTADGASPVGTIDRWVASSNPLVV